MKAKGLFGFWKGTKTLCETKKCQLQVFVSLSHLVYAISRRVIIVSSYVYFVVCKCFEFDFTQNQEFEWSWERSLMKSLQEKEKMLVTSIFTISHYLFFLLLLKNSIISDSFYLLSANVFHLDWVKILLFGKELTDSHFWGKKWASKKIHRGMKNLHFVSSFLAKLTQALSFCYN